MKNLLIALTLIASATQTAFANNFVPTPGSQFSQTANSIAKNCNEMELGEGLNLCMQMLNDQMDEELQMMKRANESRRRLEAEAEANRLESEEEMLTIQIPNPAGN
jgi:hypothetical protein